MEFAPALQTKPSIFTRIYFAFGLIAFSLSPLLITIFAANPRQSNFEAASLKLALGLILLIQALIFLAHRRCGTPERPYWGSLLVVAVCLSTGWVYLDIFLIPAGISLAIAASVVAAVLGNAPARMSHVVYWFYRHRMRQ